MMLCSEWLQRRASGSLATREFFADAMDYYRSQLASPPPLFAVASDDYAWCSEMFKGAGDVILANAAPTELRSRANAVLFDLALLSKCQHSVIR